MEYIAFGEVLFEEHSSSFSSPYLFNGKELDRETNLSYYGARYLDMKTSLWLSVDPLAESYARYSPYSFASNNPIGNQEVDGRWWFSKSKKNNTLHYGANTVRVAGASQYAFKMSSVKAVHKKQTGWASYIPIIGNWLNGSAMAQKVEDPSMSLDKGDVASLFLGAYFKGTRKLIAASGALKGGAKIALDISEISTKLMSQIASSPELKESWVELAVMEHFAGVTSDGGNAIGTLSNTKETDYTTMFRFTEDFVGELQGTYGNQYDSLKETSGMSRETYIENKVQGHMQQMFENKKTEITNKINE
ncbi:RHS repeat domain-containing protein [Mariniflexile ostreae]|uniref:RHS repeat domain-containing protein n=1 Tax=Mariniflexile ostreae TaxID=1520892 RepID=A0ABV5FC61_9FLAO